MGFLEELNNIGKSPYGDLPQSNYTPPTDLGKLISAGNFFNNMGTSNYGDMSNFSPINAGTMSPTADGGFDWKSFAFGNENKAGIAGDLLGLGQALMGWKLGNKQLDFAKDSFEQQMAFARENLARQQATQRGNIADRAQARSGAYGETGQAASDRTAAALKRYGY